MNEKFTAKKITIILIFTLIFLILSMQSISSAELEETLPEFYDCCG